MRAVIQCLLVWHVSCFESLCHLFFQSSFLWSDKLLYKAIGHAKVSQKKFNAILPLCKQTWELKKRLTVWGGIGGSVNFGDSGSLMKFSFRKQILENCTIFASCVSEFGFDFKTNSWLAYVVHWSKFQGSESSRFGILNYELQINFRFLFQKHSKWSETKLRIFHIDHLLMLRKTDNWEM